MSSIKDVLAYNEDGLIVRNLVFWLIGKTGDVHLLPAISNSIVYGIAGYITCDSAQRNHFEKIIPFALLMQICLLQFFATTSNVRNICAFSLIILAAYLDNVKEERSIRVALLYILPCFLHSSGIFLVLFRLAAGLIKNHMTMIILVGVTFLFSAMINISYANLSLFSFGGIIGDFLSMAIVKVYNYWDTESISEYEEHILANGLNMLQKLFMMIFALMILLLIYFGIRKFKTECAKTLKYCSFVYLICIMTLACYIFIAPHYWRFYSAIVIACPPIILPLFKKRRESTPVIQILFYSFPVFAFGGAILNLWRLRTAVNFIDWSVGILINNIYTIVLKIGAHFLGG